MGFLEKNLAVLNRVDENLGRKIEAVQVRIPYEVVSTRNSNLTVKMEGLSLHSTYDPQKEADQIVRRFMEEDPGNGLIFVLGMGLGYHLEKLLEVDGSPLILIEPNLEVFRIALENMDLERVLLNCRRLFVGKPIDGIFADLDEKSLPLDAYRLFVHQPSLRLNQDYFDGFKQKVETKCLLQSLTLHILVVPPIYGGSLPISRYCTRAFKRLGHRVTMIDNSIYHRALRDIDKITSNNLHQEQLRDSLTHHIAERVMAACLDLKPDLVFALAQAPLTSEVLDRMRQFEFPTAFWFVEDFREFPYWRQVAGGYGHFFAIQKKDVFEESTPLEGIDFHYLPMACDPAVHKVTVISNEDQRRFGAEISFVGAGYYNRHVFFQGLLDFDLKIWGTGWNSGSAVGRFVQEGGRRVSTRESVKIFNCSTININLHSSTYHKGINPAGDFVNPRTFEIASCGGFQLIDSRSHLHELFEPGQEIVCFESIEDLREKIAFYLSHPEEREHIAMRAQKRAHRDHAYQKRMAQALELIVGKHMTRFLALKQRAPTRQRLIAEAGAETELGRFLRRFRGKDRLSLETIVSEIHKGEGSLTDPEAVFLLMHEFAKGKREDGEKRWR